MKIFNQEMKQKFLYDFIVDRPLDITEHLSAEIQSITVDRTPMYEFSLNWNLRMPNQTDSVLVGTLKDRAWNAFAHEFYGETIHRLYEIKYKLYELRSREASKLVALVDDLISELKPD